MHVILFCLGGALCDLKEGLFASMETDGVWAGVELYAGWEALAHRNLPSDHFKCPQVSAVLFCTIDKGARSGRP